MRNLFFFGTLRHVPLLEIVMGRGADALSLTPATLSGYKVSAVAEGPFPYIAADKGAQAEGLLVSGLSEEDIARLNFYEGSFAYDLTRVTLTGGQAAEVYLPRPGHWTPQGDWSLETWETEWAALSCHAAREVMGYFGLKTRQEVAGMFKMIRARAASKVRATASKHGVGTSKGRADIVSKSVGYANFFALDDMVIEHDRFDGTRSGPIERAVFLSTDAAIVLPYDPVRDRVLLVEQLRAGPLARRDASPWQMEAIAGLIDPGETPQQAARREAVEEAGLTLHALEPIAECYPSPGGTTEFYYIYLGLADLPDDIAGLGGMADEGEDIRSHLMDFDTLMSRVSALQIANAPLMIAALWLAQHRTRLRSA